MSRIAFLTNDDPAHPRGGAGRIVAEQMRLLREAGHDVRVFVPSLDWLAQPFWKRLFYHVQDLGAHAVLVRDLSAWKPDVLISHNVTGCGFGTARAIQQRAVRWIHVLHDVQLFQPSGFLLDATRITFSQRFWSWVRRVSFGAPDLILSPTQWLLDQHVRRGWFLKSQKEVLPNPGFKREMFVRTPHNPLRLLYVARLEKDKGIDVIAGLVSRLSSVEWHLVGEGSWRSFFEKQSSVVLHGRVSREAVLDLMRTSDVLLVPSRMEENQPTVILDAAAVGLPVVASPKGGIQETLQEKGAVCALHDLDAWARAIGVLRDVSVFAQQSEAIGSLTSQHDAEVYGQRLLSFLISKR